MIMMMMMINYNSIETQRKCYLFFSENTMRKTKQNHSFILIAII